MDSEQQAEQRRVVTMPFGNQNCYNDIFGFLGSKGALPTFSMLQKSEIVPSTFGLLRAARGGVTIVAREVPPMLFARKSKGDSEVLRRARVRELFETLLSEELTETGVLLFYRWLKKYRPELLVRKEQDDPYEHLRMELEGLYK